MRFDGRAALAITGGLAVAGLALALPEFGRDSTASASNVAVHAPAQSHAIDLHHLLARHGAKVRHH